MRDTLYINTKGLLIYTNLFGAKCLGELYLSRYYKCPSCGYYAFTGSECYDCGYQR